MNADPDMSSERLASLYRHIYQTAMRGVPICNDALAVEAIGFRRFGDHIIGVVVTPWFANLVAVAPDDAGNPRCFPDSVRLRLRFPAGDVDFSVSELEGFGPLAACSLFSPMSEFADHAAARAVAQAALDALFDPHLHEAPKERPSRRERLDRRALLGGRRRTEPQELERHEKAAP